MRLELRLWLVLACAVVGGMAGYGLSFVEEAEHRAEAKVMVSSSSGNRVVDPLLPNLRELATSSLLATNVDSTLRLPGSPEDLRRRLRASTPRGTQTIAISVLDRDADRARQVAQEAATVFTQLVGSRLGDRKPSVTAVVLDPAHALAGTVGRHPVRDAGIGGAVGLLLGLISFAPFGRTRQAPPAPSPSTRKLARREALLERRSALLTERERALARRAGELGAREQALAQRAGELAAREQALPPVSPAERPPEPVPVPPVPEPPPPPVPEPTLPPAAAAEPVPAPAVQPVSTPGRWSLVDLERLVRDNGGGAPPERQEEWSTYLFFLRDHAELDGGLPPSFDGLVHEVFAELLP